MRLVTAEIEGAQVIGALLNDGDTVLDLTHAARSRDGSAPAWSASMLSLIEGGPAALEQAGALVADPVPDAVHKVADVTLLAPIPRPPRLRDASLFTEHLDASFDQAARMESAGAADPEAAYTELRATRYRLPPLLLERILYYQCDPLCVSGPEQEIVWPDYSQFADYEFEIAAVIGRVGAAVAPEHALDHIFGYTIFNDWSARDEQMKVMATGIGAGEGKDFNGSNTLGPCIVTTDELPDPYALRMVARVNGRVVTENSTASMRSTFEDAVVQFSRTNTLRPGEVIGSGTVLAGCGFERGESLTDGDVVELEVEGIGVLRNRVRMPARGA